MKQLILFLSLALTACGSAWEEPGIYGVPVDVEKLQTEFQEVSECVESTPEDFSFDNLRIEVVDHAGERSMFRYPNHIHLAAWPPKQGELWTPETNAFKHEAIHFFLLLTTGELEGHASPLFWKCSGTVPPSHP